MDYLPLLWFEFPDILSLLQYVYLSNRSSLFFFFLNYLQRLVIPGQEVDTGLRVFGERSPGCSKRWYWKTFVGLEEGWGSLRKF